jgi:PPOX class probable F420-dependent enzyme
VIAVIPKSSIDLLERPPLMTPATALNDGSTQLTPVWFNYDGAYLYFNGEAGRLKDRVLRKRPGVSLIILDPDNRARWLAIRGAVIAIDDDIGHAHIRALCERYMRTSDIGTMAEERRMRYTIEPRHVTAVERFAPEA